MLSQGFGGHGHTYTCMHLVCVHVHAPLYKSCVCPVCIPGHFSVSHMLSSEPLLCTNPCMALQTKAALTFPGASWVQALPSVLSPGFPDCPSTLSRKQGEPD